MLENGKKRKEKAMMRKMEMRGSLIFNDFSLKVRVLNTFGFKYKSKWLRGTRGDSTNSTNSIASEKQLL